MCVSMTYVCHVCVNDVCVMSHMCESCRVGMRHVKGRVQEGGGCMSTVETPESCHVFVHLIIHVCVVSNENDSCHRGLGKCHILYGLCHTCMSRVMHVCVMSRMCDMRMSHFAESVTCCMVYVIY